jgi:hypothetical protein
MPPASLVIPTVAGVPYYTMRTRLDGREYNLRFAYNERSDRWHLDIATDADEPLVSGIKLICNWPLLRFFKWDRRLPPGELRVMDLSPDGSPPGLYDLEIGRRCELTYFPVSEG